jgi:hypothetical protein
MQGSSVFAATTPFGDKPSPSTPLFPLALAHLPDTFLFSIVLQSVERIHDRILLPPDANFGERLPKPRCASVTHNSPPETPCPPEPAGKNVVSQILSCAPISSRSSARLQEASEIDDHALDLAVDSWMPSSTPSPSKPARSTSP